MWYTIVEQVADRGPQNNQPRKGKTMKIQQRAIRCVCGQAMDTSNKPLTVHCDKCGRQYQMDTPTLKLLDVEPVEIAGIVIS